MKLIDRLESLKRRYRLLQNQHRASEPVHREMVLVMCKILKREIRQERHARG